jgi:hypothetical protein
MTGKVLRVYRGGPYMFMRMEHITKPLLLLSKWFLKHVP